MLDATNAKTSKGQKLGYMTGVMYLAPGNESGRNVCPWMARCKKPCLYTSGHGQFKKTQGARIAKTRRWFNDREAFVADIIASVGRKGKAAKRYATGKNKSRWTGLIGAAYRANLTPALRLNGTSDIPWEELTEIFEMFPGLMKYDYTKSHERMLNWLAGSVSKRNARSGGRGHFRNVKNYSLTFSVGGVLDKRRDAESIYREILRNGGNVAGAWLLPEQIPESTSCLTFIDSSGKPFKKIDLGDEYEVIDGDLHDLRFLDKRGVIVGLSAKGSGGGDTKKLDTGQQRFFMQNPGDACTVAQSVPMTMLTPGDGGRPFEIGPDYLAEDQGHDTRTNPDFMGVPFTRINAGMTTTLASRVSRAVGSNWQSWARSKPSTVVNKILRSTKIGRTARVKLASDVTSWVRKNKSKSS